MDARGLGPVQTLGFGQLRARVARWLPSPRATPFASATMLLLVGVAILLRSHPSDVDGVVAWASTNLQNLTRHPVTATLASAFVVPDGLFPDLLIVAVSFAVLERAIGTARVVLIALGGHVLATMITEGGVGLGIEAHLLPAADAARSDVGISYAMYAVVAACALLPTQRRRLAGLVILFAAVTIPLLSSPDMTTAGHALSVVVGLAVMSLVRSPVLRRAVHREREGLSNAGAGEPHQQPVYAQA